MKEFWEAVGKIVGVGTVACALVGIGAKWQEADEEADKRLKLETENRDLKTEIESLQRDKEYRMKREIESLKSKVEKYEKAE